MDKSESTINESTRFSLQFNNVWAIVTSLIFTTITVTMTFMQLSNKIDLLTQKVEIIIQNQEVIISKYEGVQARLGKVEIDIKEIQTKISMK